MAIPNITAAIIRNIHPPVISATANCSITLQKLKKLATKNNA
jgi:hypothetical protein